MNINLRNTINLYNIFSSQYGTNILFLVLLEYSLKFYSKKYLSYISFLFFFSTFQDLMMIQIYIFINFMDYNIIAALFYDSTHLQNL